MDVALFGTATILSVYLPQRLFQSNGKAVEQSSMAMTLCLSLNLFCLSILDATPDTWLMILTHKEGTSIFTITRIYWMTLWALCLFLLVGLPCVTGAAAAQSIATWLEAQMTTHDGHDDGANRRNPLFFIWRKCPWWTKIICQLFKFTIAKFIRGVRKFCGLRKESGSVNNEPPILVMTVKDDEMKRIGSTNDMERRPLMMTTGSTTTTSTTTLTTTTTTTSKATSKSIIANHNHNHGALLSNHRNVLVLGCVAATGSTIVVVSSIGPLVVQASSHTGFLTVAVSWLCAIGLMVSALLNGFGSVSMPYSCLVGLYLEPIRSETITKAEAELQSVVAALQTKRSEINKMAMTINARSSSNRTSPSSGNGFNLKGHTTKNSSSSHATKMSIMASFSDLGDELTQRRQILQSEIDFLVILCKDMQEDIFEMRQSQAVAADARTTAGKIRSWLGVVFSVILLVRLISAGVSIWQYHIPHLSSHQQQHPPGKPHRSHGDFITTTLLFLTGHHLVDQNTFTMLSQFVSLVLTAVLSVSQIRTFLRTVASVNRRMKPFYKGCSSTSTKVGDDLSGTSPSLTTSSSSSSAAVENPSSFAGTSEVIYYHMIASIMGCYFLSCIILIKMMLPERYSAGFSGALGGMDLFAIHAPVVNSAYAFSALLTAAILGMLFGIQRQNTIRHRNTEKTIRGAEAC